MTYAVTMLRIFAATTLPLVLAACGGSSTGSGGGTVDDITDPDYTEVGARGAFGTATVRFVVLDGETPLTGTSILDYADGTLSGAALDGQDLDTSSFENPASGEFSRIVRISGTDTYLGAVGLETAAPDRPTGGTTDYNQGWVTIFATTSDDVPYDLTGDATLTASWGSGAAIGGSFTSLSGTRNAGESVNNVGNINWSNAAISGSSFSGGSVTGTGIFADIAGGSTTGTQGYFYGPGADEVGGVLVITDDSINLIGAFQAD